MIPLLWMGITAQAQSINDWEARPNITLKYKPVDNLNLYGTYYLYLEDNFSQYDKSVFGFKAKYKANKWLKLRSEVRYGITNKDETYYDFRHGFELDKNVFNKDWKIILRTLFQHEHEKGKSPDFYLRNRLTLSYDLNKKIELFAFTENYQEFDQGLQFYRQKTALGSEFELSKRSSIELRLVLINKSNHKNNMRVGLNYTYDIN